MTCQYISNLCPITGKPGHIRRQMSGKDLFELYGTYFSKRIEERYFPIPFDETIIEYHSEESGLVWYYPRKLGDGGYYNHLNNTYSWYYNPNSWDKQLCLELLNSEQMDSIIEIGSGDGWMLHELKKANLNAMGVEINEKAVGDCRSQGLKVYAPSEPIPKPEGRVALCMLQTIEHLDNPVGVLSEYIDLFKPEYIHLSAPCFETLLGLTSDPLSWPPHHATAWSEKSMHQMGLKIGYKIKLVKYSPLSFHEFLMRQQWEPNKKFPGLPRFPGGKFGRVLFKLLRVVKPCWFTRSHSIYVILEPA